MAPRYDLCVCGRRKVGRAFRCATCTKRERPKRPPKKVGDLSYFPENGRYAIIAVGGYPMSSHGNGYAVTFTVLDSHNCWAEIYDLTVREPWIAAERWKLVEHVKAMNVQERAAA